jgi:putative (di)nucleoside polyphosphate hydrolase
MIDSEGFRPNVGIILANAHGQVLWAKRIGHDAWQFPQGGIQDGETPEQALYRELQEEVGLRPEHVRLLAQTRGWLRYRLPHRYIRQESDPVCIGQKQKWFLLQLTASTNEIRLDASSPAEFDRWMWVSYWYPLGQVVSFKREVYRKALLELSSRLPLKD